MKNLAILEKKSPQIKNGLVKRTFPVTGMSCASCAVSIESMLKSANGVNNVSVNYAGQTAQIEYDPTSTSPSTLAKVIHSIGYEMMVEEENIEEEKSIADKAHYLKLKRRTILSTILTIPVVVLGMFWMDVPYANWISLILSFPVVFWFGRSYFLNAWKLALHGMFSMDTLVALSTGIAFLFSAFNTAFPEFWMSRGVHPHVYFEAAAVVIVFVSIGKILEDRAKSNTSSSIRKLIGLQPQKVTIIKAGQELEISPSEVSVGDLVMIKPGGKIPVDGVMSNGSSFVNESTITGEPLPVLKQPGDKVFAGTVNQKGNFEFIAKKVGDATILAQIIRQVQEAQSTKAPVQKLVDKIAGIFVPAVIGIALFTFVLWMIFGGENAFTMALLNSITVLVIACPCALGLATPTAIMVGMGKGADNNILIKDAESLEIAHRVNTVILDKTGTITEGKPEVSDIFWSNGLDNIGAFEEILLAGEVKSEHPLAEAIVSYLKKINPTIQKAFIEGFESITGKGVTFSCNGTHYHIGSEVFLKEQQLIPTKSMAEKAGQFRNASKTVLFFGNSQEVLALIALTDKIKPSSKDAVALLEKRNIEVIMLTGDHDATAKFVAGEVGIKQFKSQVLPNGKADFVKQLQSEGKIVAMVGDGINDSQALAQADISIAMGKGSDIAIDVAKITLITSDLRLVSKALNLSGNIVAGIKQNLFWAFIYNVVGIPLAAGLLYPFNGFLLNPMIAGAAMAFSSVSVVLNSLRLKALKI